MHQAVFELRQNTPVLHFLHDQPGATLRATELKPKLDIRIVEALKTSLPKHWVSHTGENGHKALDYKLRIVANAPRKVAVDIKSIPDEKMPLHEKYETQQFPHVLANVGGKPYKQDLKNLVFSDQITVYVDCWHSDLLECVKRELPALLANKNFGNRGSKGFGSFSCVKIDANGHHSDPALEYYFDYSISGRYDFQTLFKVIDIFYKCLRSGINDARPVGKENRDETTTVFYFKSLMYAYVLSKAPTSDWDKKLIKSHFFNSNNIGEKDRRDFRDWLGLSTDETWKVNKRLWDKIPLTKTSLTKGVDRFPSSIIIKPVYLKENTYRIFFGANLSKDVSDQFKKASIEIKMPKKRNQPLILTPSPLFDIDDFLTFIFQYRDQDLRDKHLRLYDTRGVNNNMSSTMPPVIEKIFNGLKKNNPTNHG